MNRVRISVAILFSIIFLCIISDHVIDSECRKLSEILTETTECIENGNSDQALISAGKLFVQWEDSRRHLSFFINSDRLESAGECVSAIQPLIRSECDEALSQTMLFRQILRHIRRHELPYIYNIL